MFSVCGSFAATATRLTCADLASAGRGGPRPTAVARETEAREAEQHHGPSGGFRDRRWGNHRDRERTTLAVCQGAKRINKGRRICKSCKLELFPGPVRSKLKVTQSPSEVLLAFVIVAPSDP
jgi:hypothetical protein